MLLVIDPFSVARDPPALRDVAHGRENVERGSGATIHSIRVEQDEMK
ncbi:hypothetical protein [Burkholderia cepacia]|nr:hypothetical protein [Burkholderia cepacia]